jgi:hypothetical protein
LILLWSSCGHPLGDLVCDSTKFHSLKFAGNPHCDVSTPLHGARVLPQQSSSTAARGVA